jgi:NAD(P)-dependent dehydrogenase (short-subunit alcohol dehydrogenase family)
MLLQNKNAVVYGAGGAIGGAVARAFAREGANVFLTGRALAPVEALAREISAAGGLAQAARVDALDARAIEDHIDAVAKEAGRIDVSFNAIGLAQAGIQGTPLVELSLENFSLPVTMYSTAHFLTATAAARRMLEQASGVILTLTATPARTNRCSWPARSLRLLRSTSRPGSRLGLRLRRNWGASSSCETTKRPRERP